MGQIIQIHETMSAKAKGAFVAVDIAARRMGVDATAAIEIANTASSMVKQGHSPAWSVSYAKALAKRSTPERSA